MSARPGPQLTELLGLLRNARDPWSRLLLVAQGARALSRLTSAQRADLLRTLGLEGAEELAELAAAGDPKVAQTLEGVLRSLESDPRRVQQIARDLADPRTRRGTLTGLAAHVMEVVTAPPPPAPAEAPPPAVRPATKGKRAQGAAAPTAPAPPAAPAATARPVAPPSPRPSPPRGPAVPAEVAAAAAAAVSVLAEAAAPEPAAPSPSVPQPPPARVSSSPPPWTSAPRASSAAAAAPATPSRGPATAEPVSPPAGQVSRTGAPAPSAVGAGGALGRLRSLRRALAARELVSAEALGDLLDQHLTSEWSRRRALAAAFAGGVPARLDDALALVERLGSAAARRWALGDLAASRAWSEAEWERLLAAADTPSTRRRLAARRRSLTPALPAVG